MILQEYGARNLCLNKNMFTNIQNSGLPKKALAFGMILFLSLANFQFAMAQEVVGEKATTTVEVVKDLVVPTEEEVTDEVGEEIVTISESEIPESLEIVEELTATIVPEIIEETVVVATSTEEVATSTEQSTHEEVKDVDAYIQSVIDKQIQYFEKNSRYLQILGGGRLPEYESGSVVEKLGAALNSRIVVNVYEGPKGKGFQVIYKDENITKAVGYGPGSESLTYTWETPKADPLAESDVATTTAATSEPIDSAELATTTEVVVPPVENTDETVPDVATTTEEIILTKPDSETVVEGEESDTDPIQEPEQTAEEPTEE